MATPYTIRDALTSDIDTLVAFTLQEAYKAEGLAKDVEAVTRGIRGAFGDPRPAVYWVAEASDGAVVASISVTTEWSDFHGGYYWWIHSLFIVAEHRGSGLLELLLDHIEEAARRTGALDLRLYAHQSNDRAHRAYRRCGFTVAPYIIMTRSVKPQR